MTTREAFEAEARKHGLILDRLDKSGVYVQLITEQAWNIWQAATDAALATPATAPEQQECKWTFDDDESNTWASGCGELWTYIDGGPSENRVKYCHG